MCLCIVMRLCGNVGKSSTVKFTDVPLHDHGETWGELNSLVNYTWHRYNMTCNGKMWVIVIGPVNPTWHTLPTNLIWLSFSSILHFSFPASDTHSSQISVYIILPLFSWSIKQVYFLQEYYYIYLYTFHSIDIHSSCLCHVNLLFIISTNKSSSPYKFIIYSSV